MCSRRTHEIWSGREKKKKNDELKNTRDWLKLVQHFKQTTLYHETEVGGNVPRKQHFFVVA